MARGLASTIRSAGSLDDLRRLHAEIGGELGRLTFPSNVLLEMYSRHGSLVDAAAVFEATNDKNRFTWTLMIQAYAQRGMSVAAIELFHRMEQEGTQPDCVTLVAVLAACTHSGCLESGKFLHARIVVLGYASQLVPATATITMYGRCGQPALARQVFDKMNQRNLVTWNAMLTGYVQNGQGKNAIDLFNTMDKPRDVVTFATVAAACLSMGSLDEGKRLHEEVKRAGFEENVIVASALVNMYGKLSSVKDAKAVYDGTPEKDLVLWSAMIAAFAQNGLAREALDLYNESKEAMQPNNVTFVSLLDACSVLGCLQEGVRVYGDAAAAGYGADNVVENALLNLFAKCGSVRDSLDLFGRMTRRSTVSWNAMITAYAQNGECKQALTLFHKMNLEGEASPNDVTMVVVLFACVHEGLASTGWQHFTLMSDDHGVTPSAKHYVLMVDLLGRTGHLDKAEQVLETVDRGSVAWEALLSAKLRDGRPVVGQP